MTAPSQPQQPEGATIDGEINATVLEPAKETVTVRLDDEEKEVGGISEGRERAVIFGMYADSWSRLGMAAALAVLFVWLNWRVIGFLENTFAADLTLLQARPPAITAADRLVTSEVLMALLGATVIQVGLAIASVVRYLFPKNGTDD